MSANKTMRRVSVRNILAHKLRLALTLLAVVLGTAFIGGSFMLTNSLSSAFDSAVSTAFTDVDASVTSDHIDEKLREEIADDPKVREVNIRSTQTVVVANEDSEAYQTGGGTSALVPYYPAERTVGQGAELTEGKAPSGDREVVINDSAAEMYGIKVGDEVVVVHPDKRETMKVSGIVKPAVSQGTSLNLQMDPGAYTKAFGDPNQLAIAAADGVSADELVDHLKKAYPTVQAESGAKIAEEMSDAMGEALKFVNYFLIAFGLIALLVGTFIIANTFSMIVAQRTKEFALLRALGASRGQITGSVVLEALIIGIAGSAVGIVAGIGLVCAIKAFLSAQDMDMGSSLGLAPNAIIIPILLGTAVTVVSAWAPARRAGSVQPVEAMRTTEQAAGSSLKARTVFGAIALVIGVACAAAGMVADFDTNNRAALVGVGAFAVIVGFFLAAPALSLLVVPWLGRGLGAPFGSVGSLAATNSRRNPRRTAATAFALTLGVALVTAIGMLGATMKDSVADTVESNINADFMLTGPTSGNFPVPRETAELASKAEGVDEVLQISMAPVTVDNAASVVVGQNFQQSLVADRDPSHMIAFKMAEGTASFTEGFVATTDFAEKHGWKVGESYDMAVAGKPAGKLELKGTFEPNQVVQNLLIASPKIPADIQKVTMVGVNGHGDALREHLQEAVKPLVVIQVMSSEDFAGQSAAAINQMLSILYALLALAVIIAVLGIINTLTLGVIERRQEIGMLRAVGTQRRQIRTMITLEAVQISIFGAIFGVLIGLGLGWAFIDVLQGSGLDKASIPWSMIVVMLVGSAVVGIVAAIWPAARAAKTPPLDAIAQ